MNLNACRLCYENEANLNIFRGDEVLVKIKVCCGFLNVAEDDGLPASICRICQQNLDHCYRFILKCESVDEKIRYLLSAGRRDCLDKTEIHSPKVEVKNEVSDLEDDCFDAEEILKYPFKELEHQKPEQTHIQVKSEKLRNKKKERLGKGNVMCSLCDRKCLNASTLTIHMRSHSNERPFQCPSCNKTYKDSSALKRHIDRNHSLNRERHFICENCGKGFYTKSDIKVHMRVHTRETPYSCQVCCARFTQLSAMLRHKLRHSDKKSYMCDTCGKPFWTKTELDKHFSVHDDIRQFSCHICNNKFKQKNGFRKHMRVHLEPNRFVCNYCGHGFNNKGNLKSHIGKKHSEKSGHCNVCLKNFSNIEAHMWRHTGQRPLKCEFCASSFYEMRALALHVNFKHKKTDRYKCTLPGCAKTFPSQPMLMYHVAKFHDKQKQYPCQKCSRSFYRKSDLARHTRGTHKELLL